MPTDALASVSVFIWVREIKAVIKGESEMWWVDERPLLGNLEYLNSVWD